MLYFTVKRTNLDALSRDLGEKKEKYKSVIEYRRVKMEEFYLICPCYHPP